MSEKSFQGLMVQERRGVTVARLKPFSSDDVDAVLEIGEELCQLAKEKATILIIDFSEVRYFEANLRGQLVRAHKILNSRGGRLAVCHLEPGMKQYLANVHFDRLILLADTLEEALAALDSG